MFTVDEATADAIRRVYEEGGELAAIVELRRRFTLFENSEHAGSCVRAIASWKPLAPEPATGSASGAEDHRARRAAVRRRRGENVRAISAAEIRSS